MLFNCSDTYSGVFSGTGQQINEPAFRAARGLGARHDWRLMGSSTEQWPQDAEDAKIFWLFVGATEESISQFACSLGVLGVLAAMISGQTDMFDIWKTASSYPAFFRTSSQRFSLL